MDEKEFLVLGKIKAPVGIKGDLRVSTKGDRTDELKQMPFLFVENTRYDVEYVHKAMQENAAIVHFKGIDDRTAAFELCGKTVAVSWKDAPELKDGTCYVRDLIGLAVYDENGVFAGTVLNVLMGPQPCYEIARDLTQEQIDGIREESKKTGNKPAVKTFLVPIVAYYKEKTDLQAGELHLKHIEELKNL